MSYRQPLSSSHNKPPKLPQKLKQQNHLLTLQFQQTLLHHHQLPQQSLHTETYQDGSKYTGQLHPTTHLKQGLGIYYQPDGTALYFGQWKNDLYDGKGTYMYADGERYEGELKEGLRDGFGRMSYRNGIVYEGGWVGNGKEGSGVERYINGDFYEGEWKGNEYHGQGRLVYLQQTQQVQGIWRKGTLLKGTLKTPNFQGQLLNGSLTGQGTYLYSDSSKYTGQFQSNLPNGPGQLTYSNGDTYTGTFKNSLKHGFGTYQYKTGDLYEGNYVNDLKHGTGVMVFANGEKYEGTWEFGLKSGNGRYTYRTREYYEGEWVAGRREGKGEYVTQRERVVGRWRGDLLEGVVEVGNGVGTQRVRFEKGRPILNTDVN